MIHLPDVTLVAMTGKGYKTKEHWDALNKSSEKIRFGDVKLIEQENIKDINDWNKAIVYDLADYISTNHAILIHSDGYIINPKLWDSDWLFYDFIGAPFPLPQDDFSYRDINGKIQRVGNSVSLRSKKLMGLPKKLNMEWKPFHGFYNEDGFISVNMRHIFEENGCRFAPLSVAKYFSKEHEIPENVGLKTFAFHSL